MKTPIRPAAVIAILAGASASIATSAYGEWSACAATSGVATVPAGATVELPVEVTVSVHGDTEYDLSVRVTIDPAEGAAAVLSGPGADAPQSVDLTDGAALIDAAYQIPGCEDIAAGCAATWTLAITAPSSALAWSSDVTWSAEVEIADGSAAPAPETVATAAISVGGSAFTACGAD